MVKKDKKVNLKKGSLLRQTWYRLKKSKLAMLGLYFLIFVTIIAIIGPWIAPYGYDDQNADKLLLAPGREYIFGTDNFGRDILSRIIYGSRVTLLVGAISVSFSLLVGSALGITAAFYRKADNFIMRIVDIVSGIPYLLFAIAIAAALGPGLINLMLAVSIAEIPPYARTARASVLTVRESEYVEAAYSIGASNLRIIIRHIMPNALSPLIVQATLGAANAVLTAACLSFLGLGIQPPSPEWGSMLSAGRIFIRDHPHMTIIPGAALMLVVYALNTLGDGLRDSLDPRLKN